MGRVYCDECNLWIGQLESWYYRLFQERSSYLEYQKVMRELDHLTRLNIAFQFVQAEVRVNNCKTHPY